MNVIAPAGIEVTMCPERGAFSNPFRSRTARKVKEPFPITPRALPVLGLT
jgi:hypothetical protein